MSARNFSTIHLSFGIELEGLVVRHFCPQPITQRPKRPWPTLSAAVFQVASFAGASTRGLYLMVYRAGHVSPTTPISSALRDRRFVGKERSAWMTEIDAVGRAIAALGTAKDAIEVRGGQGTGFHVHVGIRDTSNNDSYTLEDLQKIAMAVLHYEGQIDDFIPHTVGSR
ncbi:hypothetical protein CPB85DRAFT_1258611 [Mucidula mucida]|nr:hypothetical protein CPB85DRAFT_1258611 [Mucidula mucida]